MAKYKEIVSMCLDLLHEYSDDSNITEGHIIFLAGRFRSFLLKQRYYSDLKKQIPESNYQTLCIDLEKSEAIDGLPCEGGYILRSIKELPSLLPFGNPRVYPSSSFYRGEIAYVTSDRMRYIGHNKWLKNMIYASLAPDNHLYLDSGNSQFLCLDSVKFTGIFDNADEAFDNMCGDADNPVCDIMDSDFPLEDSLISPMIEMIVKELSPTVPLPEDENNNANDDKNPPAPLRNG